MPNPDRRITYDYTTDKLGVRRANSRMRSFRISVREFTAAGLETGLDHTSAVRLAVGIVQEIDVLARNEQLDTLSPAALREIRQYCLSVMRSGTTFSSYEIATRSIAAWRLAAREVVRLQGEWSTASVTKRLKQRKQRQDAAKEAAQKSTQSPSPVARIPSRVEVAIDESGGGYIPTDAIADIAELYAHGSFEEFVRLDREVYGKSRDEIRDELAEAQKDRLNEDPRPDDFFTHKEDS